MRSPFSILGIGHCLPSREVSNADASVSLGLPADWLFEHTGIRTRRVCAEGENVLTLAKRAVLGALDDAGIPAAGLGAETILLHIQNGLTHATPPAGIVLAGSLGLRGVRCLSLDGVCGEPINAIEIAALMFNAGLCRRAIISASVDFISLIDPSDRNTAGLFGAGAGAMIIERRDEGIETGLRGLAWETYPEHWDLGVAPIAGSHVEGDGVVVRFAHYSMQGPELARIAIRVLGGVIASTLGQAASKMDDIQLIISHQPNIKMLEMGLRRLGLRPELAPTPGAELGNMGPASLLIGLSLAKQSGRLVHGQSVLLMCFGLGFSAGTAVITV